MKAFILFVEGLWASFAFKLSFISYKFWLLLFSIAVCFIPNVFTSFSLLEGLLVYSSAKKQGIVERPAEIAIVTVPDSTMTRWQNDLYDAEELHLLLVNILHSSGSKIGLLMSEPFHMHNDSLQRTILSTEKKGERIDELLEKKSSLLKLLQNSAVVLGVSSIHGERHSYSKPFFVRQVSTETDKYLSWWFSRFGRCVDCSSRAVAGLDFESFDIGNGFANGLIYAGLPFYENLNNGLTSLWLHEGLELTPNYFADLCLAQSSTLLTVSGKTDNIPYSVGMQQSRTSAFNCGFSSRTVPLRPFISPYDKLTSYSARTIQLDLEEALSLSAFPGLVLIGAESDLAKNQDVANIIHGLQHQEVLVLPWWASLGAKAIFISVVCFAVFFLTQIRRKYLSVYLFLGVLFLIFSFALALALVNSFFFPVTWLIVTLLGFYLVLSIFDTIFKDKRLRENQIASAIDRSVNMLEENGAFNEAVYLLEHHPDEKQATAKIVTICETMSVSPDGVSDAISMIESLLPQLQSKRILQDKLNALKTDFSRTRTLQTADSKKPSGQENIPSQLGRYQVKRELGRGAVGVVYLGYDPAISRSVAIKTLDTASFGKNQVDEIKQRFYREAEAAGRLSHPNIVSVFDVGEEQALAYIAMDYVEGVPLSHHVLSDSLLPVPEVYRIVCDVASALSYAHEHQIIHRDIKPGNIMFGAEPYALKVADFGIARLLDHSRTATGEILGSPLYMSPEQLQGSKVDATADIFSLGVTFYQLLCGHLPFDAPTMAGLTYEIVHTKHKNIRSIRKDLPASAARIVNQCLQKSPRDRYQTAQELVAVLRKAMKRDFPETAKQIGIL